MTRSDSDEAIQDFTHGSGLLRCARHDGVKPYFRVLATQGIRGFANRPSLPQRAQGKPGAGRTRSLACEDLGTPAKSLQVRPMRPGLPCATVLTAYLVLSPERPACLSPSPAGYRPADLAPAAGAPGPHAFAVREVTVRPRKRIARRRFASIASRAPRFGDDRPNAPLQSRRDAVTMHDFRFS
jgi:hypothetical protein